MRAGRLRWRVSLQRQQEVGRDAYNAPIIEWVEVETVRADRMVVSDGERVRAAQTGAAVTHRFQVRASSDLVGLDPTWQLVEGGRVFDISGVKDLTSEAGALEGYEITANAQAVA